MSDNKNNDTPKFEFSAGTGFNPGSGQGAGSDDQVVTVTDGIQSISIEQPTAADGEGEEEDAGGDFMNLPKVIIKRVTAIRRMHVTYEEIDNEYKKERLELEKKYLERKQVLLDARNKIISGETEAPSSADEPDQVAAPEGGEEDVKGIPGFWLTCLSSHPTIGDLITEEDIPALEALTDISVAYEDDWTTFTLTFHFRENEFFTNKELSKRYVISPDLLDDKAPALSESTGTDIDWKPSKNLCITEIKKKQKAKSGRNKGQVRTVITTEPKPSFFQYFSSPMTEEEEEEAAENEDEDHEPVRLNMEEDYDIGHAIRTSLIPEAVLWYTGEAVDDDDEDDDEEEEEEDEEEEDEDEDGDDDEDDDDEDEDDSPPKGKGKGKGGGKQGGSKGKGKGGGLTFTPEGGFSAGGGGAAGGGAGGEQPECKQN